ncbi:MAG: trypsin-like peptidase domain-containing protein [Pseudomonadota bacterium]
MAGHLNRFLFLVALCIGCWQATVVAQANTASIFGDDDRTPLEGSGISLARGIGFIHDRDAKYTCTAFCVSDSLVATNAHCVLRRDMTRAKVKLSRVRFNMLDTSLARQSSTGTPERRTITTTTALETSLSGQPALALFHGDFVPNRNSSRVYDDWAIAKLRSPFCKGRALDLLAIDPTELQAQATKDSVFMIGYHGGRFEQGHLRSSDCGINDINHRKFLSSQRRAFANSPDLLLHHCDMEKGASGSPIFLQTPRGPSVVAVNSGYVERRQYRTTQRSGGRTRQKLLWQYTANTAVLTRAFVSGLQRFERESLLETEDQFRRVQQLLKDKGYYAGPIDAIYGPGTRRAIFRHEEERGWAKLGTPTLELLTDLENEVGEGVDEMVTEPIYEPAVGRTNKSKPSSAKRSATSG